MPARSLYLAKSGGGVNQRSHFALFIPNAEYDRDTISEDFRSLKVVGTRIHVWVMEVLGLLAAKELISSGATSIAQKERDLPTKGIFGYKNKEK
ncbi:hypothetical protein LB505_007210 [Fusarium chuoi]|nr:hypothetical protein LB505_007210 [Fusarium chuoi]